MHCDKVNAFLIQVQVNILYMFLYKNCLYAFGMKGVDTALPPVSVFSPLVIKSTKVAFNSTDEVRNTMEDQKEIACGTILKENN